MIRLKKILFCSFFFISAHYASAQQFPYTSSTNNIENRTISADYHLVWQDNFDGTQLDENNNWAVEVNGDGGGNNELQYYRRENITVGKEPVSNESCLIITAKKESFSGKTCTSGRLKTFGKMSFTHGKVEARIKLPRTANGLWPAFWMMGADYPAVGWPKCGEMDILEMGNTNGINRGTQDRYYSTWYHWGESWNGGSYPNWGHDATATSGIQDDFHLFTLIWNADYLETYLDLDKNPSAAPLAHMAINGDDVAGNAAHYFHKPFYVIFNLAIGGNFTGINNISKITALSNGDMNMYVDYVRVYQQGVAGEEYNGPVLTQTDVKTLNAENHYRVYPNPATDQVMVDTGNQIDYITVYNMAGKEMLHISNATTINISTLPSGNYLLKIIDADGRIETHQVTKK
jgi:beta-glucanase (GH16 family)